MGERRVSAHLPGIGLAARQHDIPSEVASREGETHPAGRIVDRLAVHGAEFLDIHIVTALLLVVADQLGPVETHPCVERQLLLLGIGDFALLRTSGQRQRSGRCGTRPA